MWRGRRLAEVMRPAIVHGAENAREASPLTGDFQHLVTMVHSNHLMRVALRFVGQAPVVVGCKHPRLSGVGKTTLRTPRGFATPVRRFGDG